MEIDWRPHQPVNLRDPTWSESTAEELQQGVSDIINDLRLSRGYMPNILIGSRFLDLTTPDQQEQLFRRLFRGPSMLHLGGRQLTSPTLLKTLRLGEPQQSSLTPKLVRFDEFFSNRSLDGSDCSLCLQSFLDVLRNMPPPSRPSLKEFRMGDFALTSPSQIQDFVQTVVQTILPGTELCFVVGPMYLASSIGSRECPLDPIFRCITSNMRDDWNCGIFILGIWGPIGEVPDSGTITWATQGRLVSREALQELLIRFKSVRLREARLRVRLTPMELALGALSLRDEDCTLIAQELSGSQVQVLDLRYNPDITAAGYESVGRLWDQNASLIRIAVSDEHWDATFILISCMNQMGRGQAVEQGMYENRNRWLQWLERLVETLETEHGRYILEQRIPSQYWGEEHSTRFILEQRIPSQYWGEEHSTMALDALFVTLRSKPEFLALYE